MRIFSYRGIRVLVAATAFIAVFAAVYARLPHVRAYDLNDDMASISTAPHTSSKEIRALTEAIKKAATEDNLIPKEFFRQKYDEVGPVPIRSALDGIPLCHAQAHNFGRVIYEHTHDLAASTAMCGSSCSAGCIHGVLMTMFDEESGSVGGDGKRDHITTNDLTPAFRKEIASLCLKQGGVSTYTGVGNCYHAVGHALAALADDDVSSSVGLCDLFNGYGPGAVYYCATGVYMERDIQFGESDSKISDTYPCHGNEYPVACYRYKIRRQFDLRNDFDHAQTMCLHLSGIERRGCFHGLGFGAYAVVMRNPSALNRVCGGGDSGDTLTCIEGVLGYVNLFDRSIALKACTEYQGDKSMCEAAAAVDNFGMERDFARYIGQ